MGGRLFPLVHFFVCNNSNLRLPIYQNMVDLVKSPICYLIFIGYKKKVFYNKIRIYSYFFFANFYVTICMKLKDTDEF